MTKTEMLMAKSMGAGRSLRKQKKMNDVIRREDAFNYFVALWECIGTIMDKNEWEDVCMTTANEIPPAQPEIKTDGDTISRQAAIDAFEDTTFTKNEILRRLSELPPAHPVITCDGCRFVGTYDTDLPCCYCIRREKDCYEKE